MVWWQRNGQRLTTPFWPRCKDRAFALPNVFWNLSGMHGATPLLTRLARLVDFCISSIPLDEDVSIDWTHPGAFMTRSRLQLAAYLS